MLWWIVLSHLIGRIRHKITAAQLTRINRIGGLLLGGFGATLVGEILLKALRVL
jgi:uncharacterized membrane protein YeaQ/YmgE (transglycosylase-associated protein family)